MVEGLSFLSMYGYRLLRAEDTSSEASGRICAVEYAAAETCRAVAVTYFPDLQRAGTSIRRTDDDFNFADAGSMALREPAFAEMPGEGVDKLSNYLQAIKGQLSSRYLNVLTGGEITNDAFDWSPYK